MASSYGWFRIMYQDVCGVRRSETLWRKSSRLQYVQFSLSTHIICVDMTRCMSKSWGCPSLAGISLTWLNDRTVRHCDSYLLWWMRRWSEHHVLATVQFLLYSETSRETSFSPFEYTCGSKNRQYFRLPEMAENKDLADKYVQTLNENLRVAKDI